MGETLSGNGVSLPLLAHRGAETVIALRAIVAVALRGKIAMESAALLISSLDIATL